MQNPTEDRENIMHTVKALNKRKKGKQPHNNFKKGFAEVDKTRPKDETLKSKVCKIRTRIWQTTQGKLKNVNTAKKLLKNPPIRRNTLYIVEIQTK